MFDQAPGFMALLSGPDHIFQATNTAYLQLIGHRNVIGKGVQTALPEVRGQGFVELLDHVYRTGRPTSAEELPPTSSGPPPGQLNGVSLISSTNR